MPMVGPTSQYKNETDPEKWVSCIATLSEMKISPSRAFNLR